MNVVAKVVANAFAKIRGRSNSALTRATSRQDDGISFLEV